MSSPSASALASKQQKTNQYERLMQEGFNQPSSKLRLKSTEGEIVEVQGGRVIRSLGRKDRHSKVCTSKGPRDRRVRLSAPIAIQFYDVQDRLGCDRPSKAIDWLIEKAKTAIDALAELPMPNPITASAAQQAEQDIGEKRQYDLKHHGHCDSESETVTASNCGLNSGYYDIQNQQHMDQIPIENLSSFSYYAATPISSIHLQNCPSDLNSRTINPSQSLRLSLESFEDSILPRHENHNVSAEQALFSASTLVSNATPTSWCDQQRSKMNQFQRMVACNWVTGNGDEEFAFNWSPQSLQQQVLSQDQLFSKREPLQSSNLSSIHPQMNLPISINDHCYTLALNPPLTSGVEFASDEFSGFQILSQIHGEEQEQNAVSN